MSTKQTNNENKMNEQVETGDSLKLALDDKRIVISLKTFPNLKERLNFLIEKANLGHQGREINASDLVDYALRKKFSESDFKEIRESVITPTDLVKIALNEFNKKNNKTLSIYEFCALQMKPKNLLKE